MSPQDEGVTEEDDDHDGETYLTEDDDDVIVTKRERASPGGGNKSNSRSGGAGPRPGQKNKPLQIDTRMAEVEKAFRKANYGEANFPEMRPSADDWQVKSFS